MRAQPQRVEGREERGGHRRRIEHGVLQHGGEARDRAGILVFAEVVAQHVQRVAQAREDAVELRHFVGEHQEPAAQGEQVAREIAAVHRRHVGRAQRSQRLRVVPIEPMALVLVHPVHGVERRRRALDHLPVGDVAEVSRREVGQQRQADVGGRGSMRHAFDRMLLHVVRRQEVVFTRHVGLEECPGAARQHVHVVRLRMVERRLPTLERPVQAPHDARRDEPQREDRQCDGERIDAIVRQADEGDE